VPYLLGKAVYGLPEIYRDQIRNAKFIACPGCYPTSILIPLRPLIRRKPSIARAREDDCAGRRRHFPFLLHFMFTVRGARAKPKRPRVRLRTVLLGEQAGAAAIQTGDEFLCALRRSNARVDEPIVDVGYARPGAREIVFAFRRGCPTNIDLKMLAKMTSAPEFDLHLGSGEFTSYACDLIEDYVAFNKGDVNDPASLGG